MGSRSFNNDKVLEKVIVTSVTPYGKRARE